MTAATTSAVVTSAEAVVETVAVVGARPEAVVVRGVPRALYLQDNASRLFPRRCGGTPSAVNPQISSNLCSRLHLHSSLHMCSCWCSHLSLPLGLRLHACIGASFCACVVSRLRACAHARFHVCTPAHVLARTCARLLYSLVLAHGFALWRPSMCTVSWSCTLAQHICTCARTCARACMHACVLLP